MSKRVPRGLNDATRVSGLRGPRRDNFVPGNTRVSKPLNRDHYQGVAAEHGDIMDGFVGGGSFKEHMYRGKGSVK